MEKSEENESIKMDVLKNPRFTISEVSKITGLSTDTLRYYEKKGLIISPERGGGGKRRYSKKDVGRIRFLTYIKKTNMPLKKIQDYVKYYEEHDEEKCYALLDEHRQTVEQQISELAVILQKIQYKLEHFREIKYGKTKER